MPRLNNLPLALQLALLAAGFGVLLALAWQPVPLHWERDPAAVELRLGESSYRLPRERLPWLERWTLEHFESGETNMLATAGSRLDEDLDALFTMAHARVPELADWYYSMAGEYTRLLLPLLVRGGVMEPDHLAERTERLLFGDRLLTEHLDDVRQRVDSIFAAESRATREAWVTQLARELEQDVMILPGEQQGSLNLNPLTARLTGYDSPEFIARLTASGSVGVGAAAGPMIWRTASRRAAATGRAAATRTASRTASRAGTAAAGGALGCAPAGPAALGCALLAGTAAWVGTDWLLLRIDEARNRDDFEAALHAALTASRESLRDELQMHYARASQTRRRVLEAEIEHTFIPAYHMQPRERHSPMP